MSKSLLDQKLWHKSQLFLFPFIFNFVRKKTGNLQPINDHFTTIFGYFFGHYINFFHKTEIQIVNLRCLESQSLNWIKSYDMKSVQKDKISCLQVHHFRASLPKWVLAPSKKISSHIFKMTIFPNFFEAFMSHIIRYNVGKKMKHIIWNFQ